MEYTKEINGTEMTVAISGRLDTETAPQFESEIVSEMEGIKSLVIDLGELEYISSSGLRALLALKKLVLSHGGDLVVKNACESVRSIFHLSGFDIILNVQ